MTEAKGESTAPDFTEWRLFLDGFIDRVEEFAQGKISTETMDLVAELLRVIQAAVIDFANEFTDFLIELLTTALRVLQTFAHSFPQNASRATDLKNSPDADNDEMAHGRYQPIAIRMTTPRAANL